MRALIKITILILLISVGSNMNGLAQDNSKVELIANYDSLSKSILLRWAPNNSKLWMLSLEKGYTLEKYIYQKDGKLIATPLKKIILNENLRPQPLDNWEELVLENDYAAIAAQSIYGDYIEFDEADNDIFSIVNKSKEQDARFSMTLYSADQSPLIAEKAGLFFRDKNIKEGERYLYKIYANIEDSIIRADTGLVFFGPKDFSPLPKPILRNATQENGMIQLYWLKAPFLDVFTNYIVQRTNDLNSEFKSVNRLPIINKSSGPNKVNKHGVFVDTTQLTGTVYYRIYGEDAFGMRSEPSDTIEVNILPDFEMPIPLIDSIYNDDSGKVFVDYNLDQDSQYIDRIFFERSNKADGKYKLIQDDSTFSNTPFIDNQPLSNNYYRIGVAAFDKIQYSMPSLYNVIDSIPPEKPVFSNYTIEDSVLTLHWEANPEEDMSGYRIYKSQFKNQEPSLVADIKNLSTEINFNENLKFINNERYFFLVAVDQVGNSSELSDPFKVTLPDIIPPTPPVIEKVFQKNDTVNISWKASSSEDVKNYLIYRKSELASQYKLIGVNKFNQDTFNDISPVSKSTNLLYRIVAIDSSSNESISNPYNFKYIYKSQAEDISYLIEIDNDKVTVHWKIPSNQNLSTVKIYLKGETGFNYFKEAKLTDEYISFENRNLVKEDVKVIFL